jgi:uncharacterized membrane protein YhaH (DUF805 family)
MTTRPVRSTGTDPAPLMKRTAEFIVIGIGMGLSFLVMGGFTLVMNQIDQVTFARVVQPALFGSVPDLTTAQAFEMADTLAAWFGFTLIAVLLLSVTGIFFARRSPNRKRSGWWFLAAGLVCLLGSQTILYPIAFFFFVSAGLFALRRPTDRSHS